MFFSHLMYGKHMKHMRMNLPNLPSHENFERFGTSEPVDWTLRTHILWMNLQSNDQGIWGWSQNRYPQIWYLIIKKQYKDYYIIHLDLFPWKSLFPGIIRNKAKESWPQPPLFDFALCICPERRQPCSKRPGTQKFTEHVARHLHGQVVFLVLGHAFQIKLCPRRIVHPWLSSQPSISANLQLFACQRKRELRNEARGNALKPWKRLNRTSACTRK